MQGADRGHVLKHLGETVQRVLTRQRARVDQAARQRRDHQREHAENSFPFGSLLSSRAGTAIPPHRANRYARSCAVKRFHPQGVAHAGIARSLCLSAPLIGVAVNLILLLPIGLTAGPRGYGIRYSSGGKSPRWGMRGPPACWSAMGRGGASG